MQLDTAILKGKQKFLGQNRYADFSNNIEDNVYYSDHLRPIFICFSQVIIKKNPFDLAKKGEEFLFRESVY